MLDSGYDTVVALPFTAPRAYDEALEQLKSLNQRKLLLFLQHLEELVLRHNGHSLTWSVKRNRESVSIIKDGDRQHPQRWRIFIDTDRIPAEYLDEKQHDTPGYEIKIALPLHESQPGMLFSYFPTQVRFPFPVVAHATLDLSANRQNLVSSNVNRYLITQLADLLAHAAENAVSDDDPWRPLKTIRALGSLDPVMESLGFQQALLDSVKSRRIIPRRDRNLVKPGDVKWLNMDPGNWLPHQSFKDLTLWTGDIQLVQLLNRVGVVPLPPDDFRQRLNRSSSHMQVKQRAILIDRLAHSSVMPTAPAPLLLIDTDGNLIKHAETPYLPPTDRNPFGLPEWMPIRFVSVELIKHLNQSREVLARTLAAFSVREYNFATLFSAIAARTNELSQTDKDHESEHRLNGLQALKQLYESVTAESSPKRPDSRILIPTRTGGWEAPSQLYLGAGYPNGVLMEALLGNIHPERFVTEPKRFGLQADASEWDRFLQWLGMAILPREVVQNSPKPTYRDHVLNSLTYPAQFGEYTADRIERLRVADFQDLTYIEFLDDIIQNGDSHAILAWIAQDARFDAWRRQGDKSARLFASFSTRTYRALQKQVLPSYVIWALQNYPWLPTSDGKQMPRRCVQKRLPDNLQLIFPRPALESEHPLFLELGIDKLKLRQALATVGVLTDLEDLSWEQCYQTLLVLPKVDPDGESAPAFYRVLANKEEDTALETLPLRQQFVERGQLWCQLGEKLAYRPTRSKVYFAADATLPRQVVIEFPILDLPRDGGVEKMKRIFGAEPLRVGDITLVVKEHSPLAASPLFQDELTSLKPYVFALRLDANPAAPGSTRLSDLQIVHLLIDRGPRSSIWSRVFLAPRAARRIHY